MLSGDNTFEDGLGIIQVARTVVAPPSSVVRGVWEVFVGGLGCCSCRVCVSVSGVLFSVGVCVCVCVCVTC